MKFEQTIFLMVSLTLLTAATLGLGITTTTTAYANSADNAKGCEQHADERGEDPATSCIANHYNPSTENFGDSGCAYAKHFGLQQAGKYECQ
jgi:hypothetical protein